MKKLHKLALTLGTCGAAGAVFAEGESAGAGQVGASLLTSYIDTGSSEVVTLLTAGAAIVGAFYIWGLIKKALNRSK